MEAIEVRPCSTCGEDFPITSYRWRDAAQTKRHTNCTACYNTHMKGYMAKRRQDPDYRAKQSAQARARRAGWSDERRAASNEKYRAARAARRAAKAKA